MEMSDQFHAPAALPPGKGNVPIQHEVVWVPKPAWTGFPTPDSTARSWVTLQLSYLGSYSAKQSRLILTPDRKYFFRLKHFIIQKMHKYLIRKYN